MTDPLIDILAPDPPRTRYGSVIWPDDPIQAWMLLCDLARVQPDSAYSVEILIQRLRLHGEQTQRRTVERIYQARP